jgi:hypothetical protein
VADYIRTRQAAKLTLTSGKLTVSLPDDIAGSALTLRLSGISAKAIARAPEAVALYRHGDTLVLASPRLGPRGTLPAAPRVKRIYDG